MKICFLIHHKTPLAQAENAVYLGDAARALGHIVMLAAIDSLACHDGAVTANSLSSPPAREDMAMADLVWVLSLGSRATFLDKIQLLKLLAEKTRVVNSPEALLFYHSKASLAGFGMMPHPETHIAADAETLWGIYRESGLPWVIKPLGESFGKGVALLAPRDPHARGQIEAITMGGARYCLLQAYVPEIGQGEKRVLLAAGKVVGQYLRRPGRDFRTNLHQGGQPELCDLPLPEKEACEQVGKYLTERGIFFAGLDIAWPWLLEWNVVSPGGIATIDRLGGGNRAPEAVKSVLEMV